NGTLISVADVDAASSSIRVRLIATNGTLTLSAFAGLTFLSGDGTADADMTFTGTVSSINTALNGLTFTPTLNYNGAAVVQIITNDQRNTGSGGPLVHNDTVNITVNAINDAPVTSVPAAPTINEDNNLVFSTPGGNAIQ